MKLALEMLTKKELLYWIQSNPRYRDPDPEDLAFARWKFKTQLGMKIMNDSRSIDEFWAAQKEWDRGNNMIKAADAEYEPFKQERSRRAETALRRRAEAAGKSD